MDALQTLPMDIESISAAFASAMHGEIIDLETHGGDCVKQDPVLTTFWYIVLGLLLTQKFSRNHIPFKRPTS